MNWNDSEIEKLLRCPKCNSSLKSSELQITCCNCKGSYPIIDGIPRLVADDTSFNTRLSFNHKWSLYYQDRHPLWRNWIDGKFMEISYGYPVSEERYGTWKDFLLHFLRVDSNYFKGKRVLDAGCGAGWVSYTMARLGAKVIAADLADSSVTLTYKILSDQTNSKVFQTDLIKLPFKKESFDSVVSLGVMHHTFNTKHTFFEISKTVKPGGDFFIHVYEKVQPNKENLTEIVRKVIRLFPKDIQLEICNRFLSVDFDSLKDKPLKRKCFRVLNLLIMLSKTPEEAFDTYSPKYNHRHTFDEVKSWYEEAGFTEIKSLTHLSLAPDRKQGYGGGLWMVGRKRKNLQN